MLPLRPKSPGGGRGLDGGAYALDLRNVTKRFGGLAAVSDVSLRVERGERIGLIGPNGAGKTTLIKLMAGEFLATTGQVSLLGQEVTKEPAHVRARIGLGRTFQITELFFELTVRENLLLAERGRSGQGGWKPIADRFGFGAAHLDKPVGFLGYGEQRQLELAMALVRRPDVLLLDEPAAGLDADARTVIRQLIADLPEELTLLIIDHDVDLIMSVSQRVVCMANGSIIADGSPEAVVADPHVREQYLGVGGAS